MQTTNHYRLPYLQGSDTVDKLPEALRRFAEGIDNAVHELSQQLEQKGPESQEELKRAIRQVKDLSENYAGISQAVSNLLQIHSLRVKPMLEAWENLGSDKDTVLRPLMDRISKLENGGSAPKLKLKGNQVAVDFTNDVPVIVAGNPSLIDLIKKKTIRLVSGTYTANHQVMTARYELKEIGDSLAATSYIWAGQDDQMIITFTKTS